MSLSNSDAESERLAREWFLANKIKNEASRVEAKTKKELQEFTENSSGNLSFDVDGKQVNLSFGLTEVVQEKINPRKLHDMCVKLKMEDQFWSVVTVGVGAASEIFPETILAKTKDSVVTKNWAIKKEK